MQYLLYILAIPFLYLNYKIVISDLKNKIIPNKYLGYLLLIIPFYYIYIFFTFPDINYLLLIGQIVLTFIISFILYYFGIWAAGDAKYLLVLSLFIPYIGIIPLLGNLAIVTLGYLLLYFIWFYFGKCIFYKGYAKGLYNDIKTDLSEKWNIHKQNERYHLVSYKGKEITTSFFIILKWVVIFLIIFISIRLSRIYLFNNFFENGNSIGFLKIFIEKYNIYLVFLLILLFIGGLYLIKLGINKLKLFIGNKLGLNIHLIGNIFISILFILLSSFLVFEYIKSPNEISRLLFLIFTLYISIYIIFKILIYSYKITFGIAEMEYINIKDLKDGDIVDKEYLINIFGRHGTLQYIYQKGYNLKSRLKKRLIIGNVSTFFYKINSPINKECKKILTNLFNTRNLIFKKYKKNSNKLYQLKILKTFSFAPYIIIGFLLTFFFQNQLIIYIINYIFNIIKSFY